MSLSKLNQVLKGGAGSGHHGHGGVKGKRGGSAPGKGGGGSGMSPNGYPIVNSMPKKTGWHATEMNLVVEEKKPGSDSYTRATVKYPVEFDVFKNSYRGGELDLGRMNIPRTSDVSSYTGKDIGKVSGVSMQDIRDKFGV